MGTEIEAILAGRTTDSIRPKAAKDPDPTWTPPLNQESKHNLPAQITPFIGREAELAELSRLLAEPQIRLLTILGPGGMGKTRLALEAAQTQLAHYPQGVYFVPLAPWRKPTKLSSPSLTRSGMPSRGTKTRPRLNCWPIWARKNAY